jgi:hypothetical protein
MLQQRGMGLSDRCIEDLFLRGFLARHDRGQAALAHHRDAVGKT